MLGQDGDGVLTYNEGVLKGLDYALDQARQHGIKVLLGSCTG